MSKTTQSGQRLTKKSMFFDDFSAGYVPTHLKLGFSDSWDPYASNGISYVKFGRVVEISTSHFDQFLTQPEPKKTVLRRKN